MWHTYLETIKIHKGLYATLLLYDHDVFTARRYANAMCAIVCPSVAVYVLKWLSGSNWCSAQRLLSAYVYATLCCHNDCPPFRPTTRWT